MFVQHHWLLYPNQGGWLIGYFCATNRYKTYHNDMVEARIHFRLDYISLSYNMYKVFKPLPMQLMVMMKIDLFYVFRPSFVPAKFWELCFNLLSLILWFSLDST